MSKVFWIVMLLLLLLISCGKSKKKQDSKHVQEETASKIDDIQNQIDQIRVQEKELERLRNLPHDDKDYIARKDAFIRDVGLSLEDSRKNRECDNLKFESMIIRGNLFAKSLESSLKDLDSLKQLLLAKIEKRDSLKGNGNKSDRETVLKNITDSDKSGVGVLKGVNDSESESVDDTVKFADASLEASLPPVKTAEKVNQFLNVDLTDHHKWAESIKKQKNEQLQKLENDINAVSSKIELLMAERKDLEKRLERSDIENREQLKNRMLSLLDNYNESIGVLEKLKNIKCKHERVVERGKKRRQIYSQYF